MSMSSRDIKGRRLRPRSVKPADMSPADRLKAEQTDYLSNTMLGDGGCRVWLGKARPGFPPMYVLRGESMQAIRAAHILFKGVIPTGARVERACTTKRCVEPAHLIVTQPAIQPAATQPSSVAKDGKSQRSKCPTCGQEIKQ